MNLKQERKRCETMKRAMSRHITDSVHEFYSLPLPEFITMVAEFTRNDRRLELLFYATRQRYLDALDEVAANRPPNVIDLDSKRPS